MLKKKKRKISGTPDKPRVVISKSNFYLTAQAIDDINQKTVAYLCTKDLNLDFEEKTKNKKSNKFAAILGLEFSKILVKNKFSEVIFDRNGYKYHGKIKTFREEMQKSKIRC